MADPLSLCASIIAVATAGIQLSTALYTFSTTVYRADKSVAEVAQEISLTSSILQELGNLLGQEEKSVICSENAARTAKEASQGCQSVFDEVNDSIQSLKRGKSNLSTLGKLKWPFTEKKMVGLRSNLERLKTALILLLSVLNYAGNLRLNRTPDSELQHQRDQIKELLEANRLSQERFLKLQQELEAPPTYNTAIIPQSKPTDTEDDSHDVAPSPEKPSLHMTNDVNNTANEDREMKKLLKHCAMTVREIVDLIKENERPANSKTTEQLLEASRQYMMVIQTQFMKANSVVMQQEGPVNETNAALKVASTTYASEPVIHTQSMPSQDHIDQANAQLGTAIQNARSQRKFWAHIRLPFSRRKNKAGNVPGIEKPPSPEIATIGDASTGNRHPTDHEPTTTVILEDEGSWAIGKRQSEIQSIDYSMTEPFLDVAEDAPSHAQFDPFSQDFRRTADLTVDQLLAQWTVST